MVDSTLLATAAAAALAAAPAATTHPPQLYRATLSGTITAQWNFTTPETTSGGCTSDRSETGTRVVEFRTTAPVLLRVRDGRLAARDLAPIAGTTTTTGISRRTETCGDAEPQETHLDCVRTMRTFSQARVRFSTRPRSIALGALQRAYVGQALGCPGAPPGGELVRAPLLGSVRISLAHVVRATRVVVPGGFDEALDLGGGVSGRLTWSTSWKLTLRRVQP